MATSTSLPLADKIIIVTGATSGIGASIAKHAVEAGATVVLAGRREDRLSQEVSSLTTLISEKNLPGKVSSFKLDVTKSAEWDAIVQDTIKVYGRIDILVNNAGVMLLSKVLNLHVDEWMSMVDINIKGVFLGTAAVLPHFKERKAGYLLNISSDADRKVFSGSAVYSATKAAVTRFTEGVRLELTEADLPIRVSSISPGAVATELSSHITDKDIFADWSKGKPFEFMQPQDIAEIVIFVLSRNSRVDIDNIFVRPQQQSS